MAKGFITLDRQLEDNWLWKDKPFSKGQAWVDLIFIVNHTDNKFPFDGTVYDVKRSQTITSLKKLSVRWGWSTGKVGRFLDCLESDAMLIQKRDTKKTVLALVNYDKYQGERTANETVTKRRRDADETQTKTNNNDKAIINNEKECNIAIAHFETFWSAYPRKTNRAATEKIFAKLKVDDTLIAKMLTAVEVQKQSSQWQDIKYIPYPTTWLNQKRWEDIDGEPFRSPPNGGNESVPQGKYGTYL